MRVLLGNSPWLKPGFYGVRAGSRWPHMQPDGSRYMPFPFFKAYAAAVLEENGYFPLLLDAIAERISLPLFIYKIKKYKPEMFVL